MKPFVQRVLMGLTVVQVHQVVFLLLKVGTCSMETAKVVLLVATVLGGIKHLYPKTIIGLIEDLIVLWGVFINVQDQHV